MGELLSSPRLKSARHSVADLRFVRALDVLQAQAAELVSQPGRHFGAFSEQGPQQGVYLFSEGDDHLFVGRTSRLYQRLMNHCRGSAHTNRSALKLKVMLADSRFSVPVSRKTGWEDIFKDQGFGVAFEAAKTRINKMQIRFVEERDSLNRYLLEAYCAVAFDARYSDIDIELR
ncbi:GIY-YIG nuclease family protein [Phenylobacterium montanum]|uniref:GIY-YIG nuclease family protein n=1 Tax=Phenylobacterium montanum TaxID=2823693 RepID=A0A975G0L4_9CAUL|nr:GIY-YIG nuclease family protein [Caulobacter sp. S6]QUD88357.1 GIY-YIG nuclease family protein [Caulobacter sp. S6]